MPDLGLGLVAAIAILAAAGRRAGLPDPIVFALATLRLGYAAATGIALGVGVG